MGGQDSLHRLLAPGWVGDALLPKITSPFGAGCLQFLCKHRLTNILGLGTIVIGRSLKVVTCVKWS